MKIGCTPSELGESGEEKIRQAYLDYVTVYGGESYCLEPAYEQEAIEAMIREYDGFIFTGGQDVDPSCYGEDRKAECGESAKVRDDFELLLAKECLRVGKPVFGICRGLQLLNVAAGGTLIQDIDSEIDTEIVHPQEDRTVKYAHSVQTVEGTYFAKLLGKESFKINSFHHQAAKKIAPGFRAGVMSPDGIVEAIESIDRPWIKAVQWHPERMDKDEPFSKALMEDFLHWCRR